MWYLQLAKLRLHLHLQFCVCVWGGGGLQHLDQWVHKSSQAAVTKSGKYHSWCQIYRILPQNRYNCKAAPDMYCQHDFHRRYTPSNNIVLKKKVCSASQIFQTSPANQLPYFNVVSPTADISWTLNNIAKQANFSNNVTWKMEIWWFDDGKDGDHSAVGFVEISDIYICDPGCIFLWNIVIRQSF